MGQAVRMYGPEGRAVEMGVKEQDEEGRGEVLW
jgi:hypothetical protein